MYGLTREPKFPTKIPSILKIIGSLMIAWSILDFLPGLFPFRIGDPFPGLMAAMCVLHLVLGIVFILNGIALTRIIEASKEGIERASL